MNWRLAKFSCAQIIGSAFSCLDKGGHYCIPGNQQNFLICFPPHISLNLTLPGKFIAGSGHGPILITKVILHLNYV